MAIRDLKARVVLTADTKGLSRGFRTAETSVDRFSKTASKLGALALGGGAVALAVKGFEELQRAANLEAQEESLRRTLGEVGQDFDGFIAKLKEVSDNTVSTADLIQSSSRALLLGIPAEQISELLEVARTRAIATGQEVGTAFNDISVGIGRLSPLILDNLGFTIRLSDAYEAFASEIGKTTEELNKQEQQQAVTNVILEQGRKSTLLFGDAAEGAATQFQQLTAAFSNARDAIALYGADQAETNVTVTEFFESLKDLFQLISGEQTLLEQFRERNDRLATSLFEVNVETNKLVSNLDALVAAGEAPIKVFNDFQTTVLEAAAETEIFERNLKSLTDAGIETADAIDILARSEERLKRIQEDLTAETETYLSVLDKLNIKTDQELNESLEKLELVLQRTEDEFNRGRISQEQFERTTVRVTAEILKLETQLSNTAPEFLALRDAIDETSVAEDVLTVSTDLATEASRRLEQQNSRTRGSLTRLTEQVEFTSLSFDNLTRSQGQAAAVAAALAAGGRLVQGGTRIEFGFGGGSRIVRPFGSNPASGSSRRQSRFFDNLTTFT